MTEQNTVSVVTEKLTTAAKKPRNWMTAALVAATATLGTGYVTKDASIFGPPAVHSNQDLAAQKVGEPVEMTAIIAGGKEFGPNLTLLNTSANYQDPSNVTFRCPGGTQVAQYKGKKVKVTGTRSEYNGKPQIAVDKIEVVK